MCLKSHVKKLFGPTVTEEILSLAISRGFQIQKENTGYIVHGEEGEEPFEMPLELFVEVYNRYYGDIQN